MKRFCINAILIAIIASLLGTSVALWKINKTLHANIERNGVAIEMLSCSIQEIAKQRTLALQITPSIHNRVTSAFGATKNVTLNYYFTIDGNSIITKPDSIYQATLNR